VLKVTFALKKHPCLFEGNIQNDKHLFNVMERDITKKLTDWKARTPHQPLILRGARQVGKTWAVEQLGANAFAGNFVKIDFEKRRDLAALFAGNLSAAKILPQLEIATGKRIIAGETLLFFDEIQVCPRAITALRYFYEEVPELHVIAAGSLLDFAFGGDVSVPVGRVTYLTLTPLTFREFLLATGNAPAADSLARPPQKFASPVHHELLDALKTFFFVGGMPACVSTWIRSRSLLEVAQVQDDLLNSFSDDFAKYGARVDKTCLAAVLQNAARAAGAQISYTRLAENFSSATNHRAFDLLCRAQLLRKIPAASPAALPLGASVNEKKFKTAFLDIGLLQRLCGVPVDIEIQQRDLLAMWRGQLAEQFVAQELIAANSAIKPAGDGPYYWVREARNSQAEVDFLTVAGGRVQPIEVKSGAAGSLKSLHLLLREFPNTADAIVLSCAEYAELPEARLRFLPLYYAGGSLQAFPEK
jgi:predicted AAA+ superfamily ATPase